MNYELCSLYVSVLYVRLYECDALSLDVWKVGLFFPCHLLYKWQQAASASTLVKLARLLSALSSELGLCVCVPADRAEPALLRVDVRRMKKRDLSSGLAEIHKTSTFLWHCSTLWKHWIDFLNLCLTSVPGMAPPTLFPPLLIGPSAEVIMGVCLILFAKSHFPPVQTQHLTHALWISSRRFDFSDLKRGLRMFERPSPETKLSFKNLHVDGAQESCSQPCEQSRIK